MKNLIIEKIKKLFALSTSSNSNEAYLAALKAKELMNKNNIKMDMVDPTREYQLHPRPCPECGRMMTIHKIILSCHPCDYHMNLDCIKLDEYLKNNPIDWSKIPFEKDKR